MGIAFVSRLRRPLGLLLIPAVLAACSGGLTPPDDIDGAGVSAIEAGRLAPSVTAGLALARALECTVEQLFAPVRSDEPGAEWAISPATDAARYWQARLGGRLLMYPVGDDALSSHWHDGVCRRGAEPAGADLAERTLVVAGCDPAAGTRCSIPPRSCTSRICGSRERAGCGWRIGSTSCDGPDGSCGR